MGSRVVIDQQALATGYVHWKRTVPYSNVVQKTAQTICTGYKENIVVLESGYFFDYLCHWNWFLLSLLIFILFLYFFNSRGRVPLAGNSLRAEKSHWQVQKVTLAGPKSHTRAKMSHWSVIMTICAGNSPVPGEFPAQRPVTRSFDIFFDLCLNKRLSKQS